MNHLTSPTDSLSSVDDELATPLTEVDHRFGGVPLDSWLGYTPESSLLEAIGAAADNYGDRFIAFCVLPEFSSKTMFKRQKRAGHAWVTMHHPGLDFEFRTKTVPFRGVGPEVRVLYVSCLVDVERSF